MQLRPRGVVTVCPDTCRPEVNHQILPVAGVEMAGGHPHGRQCVDRIITERAVIDVTPAGLVLVEMSPGETFESIQAVTEPTLGRP